MYYFHYYCVCTNIFFVNLFIMDESMEELWKHFKLSKEEKGVSKEEKGVMMVEVFEVVGSKQQA